MQFFSMLQRTGIEKVHSAAIAWLISNHNTSMTPEQKSLLISALCGTEIVGEDFCSVETEHEYIDILIHYSKTIIAIENKIKTSEHGDQLKKYSSHIENTNTQNKRIVKVFLSLIGEKPSVSDWTARSYDDFLDKLISIESKNDIIIEFRENLRLLVECKREFLNNHQDFPNVFTDGSKKKQNKIEIENASNKYQKYISENNLETILQKFLFSRIVENINYPATHTIIAESRGNALIDFKNPNHIPHIEVDSLRINTGIQIQNGSIKVQFESGLDEAGNPKPRDSILRAYLDKYIPMFFERLDLKSNGWRLNKPRNEKSSYYSISRNLEYQGVNKGIQNYTFKENIESIQKSIQICEKLLTDIASEFKK